MNYGSNQRKGGPPETAYGNFHTIDNVKAMKGQQMQAPPKTTFENYELVGNTRSVKGHICNRNSRSVKGQQKRTAKKPSVYATKKKFYLRNN